MYYFVLIAFLLMAFLCGPFQHLRRKQQDSLEIHHYDHLKLPSPHSACPVFYIQPTGKICDGRSMIDQNVEVSQYRSFEIHHKGKCGKLYLSSIKLAHHSDMIQLVAEEVIISPDKRALIFYDCHITLEQFEIQLLLDHHT